MFTSLPVCIGVYFLGFLDSRLSFMVKLGLRLTLSSPVTVLVRTGATKYLTVSYLDYA